MKALVAFRGVPTHLIWPLEIWLILYFLQDLVHMLSKHSANYLGSCRSNMPSKISPRLIVVVCLRSKIPSVLGNYFSLPISLLLILLYSFILINSIHELMHAPSKLPCQRLP